MVDVREALMPADLMELAIKAKSVVNKIDKVDPHFKAKVARFKLILESKEEIIRTMAIQYKELGFLIDGLERMESGLTVEEKKYFDFMNIDELKAEQAERLEAMQILLTVPIPGLEGIPLINYKPE
ncbi:hypothetical protein [Sporosarcina jiandibaonis]|uniref:hypothetical protein n=1 Tax=Sporosarcina jiandibaonis TaxID=2715535 RepID=UPI001557774A|nr:hypothetical protein [Sporosarcina jiandibaonis]